MTIPHTDTTIASDEQLKRDIHDSKNNLAKLLALRLVNFHWQDDVIEQRVRDADDSSQASRANYAREQIGLIAQEVEQVFPHWVSDGGDGYKRLDLSELNMVLIGAVQELARNYKSLKAEFQAFKSSLEY